ncbi:MAG: LacI family DNA-binding transcriptional regulator [Bacteroidota bacterium]
MTTIYDIAKALSITPSTVSRALSDHPHISARTKARVKAKAAQLGYRPNGIAAALRRGKTFIIGVMVPTTDRSFFSSVIRGIEGVASKAGFNVLITQSNDSTAVEAANIDTLLKTQVDGIIASIAKETTDFEHFRKINAQNRPLVLFDRVKENLGASTVVIDDYLGGYYATEHLIQQGYQRIAHLSGAQHINIYKYRHRGYQEALSTHGIPYDPSLVLESNHLEIQDGRAGMEQLLQLHPLPDAIFAASDFAAVGAMQLAKEKGLRIPQDLGIVGFANEPFTDLVEPRMSTVEQHSAQMGELAAETLLANIQKQEPDLVPKKLVLTPSLITRASSVRPNFNIDRI